MTSGNGVSVKLCRHAAQLTPPVKPAKHPPTGLKLVRATKMDSKCYSVCHHTDYAYVGLLGSTVYRFDHQGKLDEVYASTNGEVTYLESLAAHENRLFFLKIAAKCTKVLVLGLNDGKLLTSWTVPYYEYCGRRMSLIKNDQLAVGDWTGKQIIIYSLTGDVIRKVPLPHCLTMESTVCMSSCGADNVVISDWEAGKIVKLSLE